MLVPRPVNLPPSGDANTGKTSRQPQTVGRSAEDVDCTNDEKVSRQRAVMVACGRSHSAAITTNGNLLAWGSRVENLFDSGDQTCWVDAGFDTEEDKAQSTTAMGTTTQHRGR